MLHKKKLSLALALVAALGAQSAFATDVALTMDGQWREFNVDDFIATSGGLEWINIYDGSALSFSFSGPAKLMVVDSGFAGDQFKVFDNGVLLGETSVGGTSYPTSNVNFDANFASADYSKGVYLLGAGNHVITGMMSVSAVSEYGPINATLGAVQISAVPEPESYAMLLAGLGLMGLIARRRA